jgi:hypothetical protein
MHGGDHIANQRHKDKQGEQRKPDLTDTEPGCDPKRRRDDKKWRDVIFGWRHVTAKLGSYAIFLKLCCPVDFRPQMVVEHISLRIVHKKL